MEIRERYTDDAGKYRVVVDITNERAIPLKYQTVTPDATVLAECQRILDAEAEQAQLKSWISIDFSL